MTGFADPLADAPAVREIEPAPVAGHEAQVALKVLVIDDALTVRVFCNQLLTKAGFEVVEAINGLEGLEAALQTPFDLFVVDINMKKMDGYKFLQEARRHPDLAAVPAIMMSTEGSERDVEKAYAAGANFYLFKPIQPDRFVECVRLMSGVHPS